MDRNAHDAQTMEGVSVALRKESVDRNLLALAVWPGLLASLSARRAWIEIIAPGTSVFRGWSLSARRAWIEIYKHKIHHKEKKRRSPQGERG